MAAFREAKTTMKQITMRKWLASALIAAGITATASPLGPAAFADVGLAEA
jgi:hypothetical protein